METRTHGVYKVGDVLRVRSWEDMAEQYEDNNSYILPVDKFGNKFGKFVFIEDMRKMCGKTFTVKSVYTITFDGVKDGVVDEFHSEEGSEGGFYVETYMLEPAEEQGVEIAPEDELEGFLFGGF